MMDAWAFNCQWKHGRKVAEFDLKLDDAGEDPSAYHVRIDLGKLRALAERSATNNRRVAVCGPLQIRPKVKGWLF